MTKSGDAAILRHAQQQIAGDGGRQTRIRRRHQDVALACRMQRAEQGKVVGRPRMAGDGGAHHDRRRGGDRLDAIVEAAIAAHGIHQIAGGHAGEAGEQALRRAGEAPPDPQHGRVFDHGMSPWVEAAQAYVRKEGFNHRGTEKTGRGSLAPPLSVMPGASQDEPGHPVFPINTWIPGLRPIGRPRV